MFFVSYLLDVTIKWYLSLGGRELLSIITLVSRHLVHA